MSHKALFLDRDGVVNVEIGYLSRIEDVEFVPGIFSLCRTAMRLGYRLVIVTNQAGIARGYYDEAAFESLMDWMREQMYAQGVELDGVYYCPYHPEHGIKDYKREHEDRKPGTGMLRKAMKELDISLADSVMVGDRCSDIAAANSAGLRQAFLLEGTENAGCSGHSLAVKSLAEVERWLEAHTGGFEPASPKAVDG
ncbi:D-glycero-beta-D-manno-heptose 1,7-bisphosphate 7-phosphatase [Edaphobacter sp. 12200R-103]|jgi:D-glycero-D-manno-heptose 1,7-bisphosphate phosphatase|uniref:D-glycero-alpha-D-manno-heptose-1,7-bisphosphate 7-phosphatase n=1 Tax=Edaphobacter sp. 12200R-103 TaxID=2703788 RepID=UPI00138DA868|nr:HAD family hydrolase [Edaphobacter sp. 12200R-103]QHS52971.1 HAD family hydrolase [Edaphobacter sp. 12200R-103]